MKNNKGLFIRFKGTNKEDSGRFLTFGWVQKQKFYTEPYRSRGKSRLCPSIRHPSFVHAKCKLSSLEEKEGKVRSLYCTRGWKQKRANCGQRATQGARGRESGMD